MDSGVDTELKRDNIRKNVGLASVQKNIRPRQNEILKLIAIVSMLIDHIGLVFFPEITYLRIIGRIAFPIFAYQIAKGTIHTSNKINYIVRLLTFAAISQLPYMFLLQTYNLNIIFTLVLSVVVIICIQHKQWIWILVITISFTAIEYTQLPKFEYTWYGVLLSVTYYLFQTSKKKTLIFQSIITWLFVITQPEYTLQIFAIIGFFLCLYFPVNKVKVYMNKLFFYYFYPVHLMIILMLSSLAK